ncbi:MAG: SDR family oxidoreductase [Acidiferrobacteraceae bacterium]
MTISLSRELTPVGTRGNAVSPRIIDTDKQTGLSLEQREVFGSSVPMRRVGRPEEATESII